MNQEQERAPEIQTEDSTRTSTQAETSKEAEEGAPAGAEAAPRVSAELAELRAELDSARAEAADNFDKFVRAKAEIENVRRRAEADVASAHKFGIERFAAELLAVRDSLELARAVELNEENTEAVRKMHEGLDLTLKLMEDVFKKFSVTQIDPKGERFDPEKHHALSVVESDEVPPNHVVTVVQKGYQLHERVLRPALVVVARAKPTTGGDPAPST